MSQADENLLTPEELRRVITTLDHKETIPDSTYRIHLEERHELIYIILVGNILHATPESFVNRIEVFLSRLHKRGVVLDLQECTYLSSTVMTHFIRFLQAATAHGSQIVALHPNERICTIIDILGIGHLFKIVNSEKDALQFFSEQNLLTDTISDDEDLP